jgi:uncharacterized Zn finger protein
MIKLESSKMQKAIATAMQVRPRVRRIGERNYSVTGRRSDAYTVRFVVVNGLKLAECDCPVGQAQTLCYHICAAAALNIAVHSIYSKPSESPKAPAVDNRAALIAEIETRWTRKHPKSRSAWLSCTTSARISLGSVNK